MIEENLKKERFLKVQNDIWMLKDTKPEYLRQFYE